MIRSKENESEEGLHIVLRSSTTLARLDNDADWLMVILAIIFVSNTSKCAWDDHDMAHLSLSLASPPLHRSSVPVAFRRLA